VGYVEGHGFVMGIDDERWCESVECSAQRLYDACADAGLVGDVGLPGGGLALDMVGVVKGLGGGVWCMDVFTEGVSMDTPTIEVHDGGGFTLNVVYGQWVDVEDESPMMRKSLRHQVACLLGTYLLYDVGKSAGVCETYWERRYGRRRGEVLMRRYREGLYFGRCFALPRSQFLAEWGRLYDSSRQLVWDVADAFGVDYVWAEVRARQLGVLTMDGKRLPSPVRE
jgi:hypothetical protein